MRPVLWLEKDISGPAYSSAWKLHHSSSRRDSSGSHPNSSCPVTVFWSVLNELVLSPRGLFLMNELSLFQELTGEYIQQDQPPPGILQQVVPSGQTE